MTRTAERTRKSRRAPDRTLTPPTNPFAELRQALEMTRSEYARLLGFSERAVADWEAGKRATEPAVRAVGQLQRIYDKASSVMEANYVGKWLMTSNKALGNEKPVQLLERGETDRLWRVLFTLEACMPL